MLKLKYYTLEKEEFYNTEYGKGLKKRLNRLLIIGIIGLLFSTILFIFPSTKWDIVLGIILVIASLIFIYSSYQIRINKINIYLTKKKK